jgi:uncharacterized protein
VSSPKEIIINSRKFDGRIHRTWKARLLDETEELYSFVGVFESEVKHVNLGVIRRGTVSYEYYWKNRWFNVFRFHEPEGGLRNFYCNINQPPHFAGGVLDYIDLDIDVLIWEDFSLEILDEDEFAENARRYKVPEKIKTRARDSLAELLQLIERREFPFDFKR